jgi:predicted RND superfamily exporter protein
MGYRATKVQLSYEMARMLPANDKNLLTYQQFKKVFGEDGNVIFVGFQDSAFFQIDHFNQFYTLCEHIQKIDGIEKVLSVTNVYSLVKDDSLQKFDFLPLVKHRPSSQTEVDSLKERILSLKFYDNLLFNKESSCYMTGITLTKAKLNDKSRIQVVKQIKQLLDNYALVNNLTMHYSGLPYIRTVMTQMIQDELYLFIMISLVISILIMIMFFRSFAVVATSMLVVLVSVIWSMGIISLFGYKISILIGVLPSLLIIIAIENCIYLVNKFHWEYKKHGNKMKSLSRVVSRIGFATFMTNVTTATGFATFIFTSNAMLNEFGIVSSINIMIEYVLSVILTVIIYSYLAPPKRKHLKHLDRRSTKLVIDKVKNIIEFHRKSIYITSGIIIAVCIYGITRMQISGKLVDDIPEDNSIYKDLKFFEKNAGGVMPFEISIDTKEKKGVFKDGAKVVYKIKQLQKIIRNDSTISQYFSRPVSIVEAISFANQVYKNGNPRFYIVPPPMELSQIGRYVGNTKTKKNSFHSFIDSNMQITRVSIQMADIGTKEMNRVLSIIKPQVDSIFPPKDYTVVITGNSVVFSKGTEFLINNLWESIVIGIFLISILMAIIFSSIRMIIIAMLVNLTPLLITGAIMGFFNIPVKPSTIIVFSVALGISIDNAILYLTRYRHELKKKRMSTRNAVMNAMNEAGISMIYTSIVLVLGFAIFMLSDFGGTKALGFLISVTLFIALFFNIIVLPALLLSFDKYVATPAFEKPLIDMFDEEAKIEQENKL